MTTISAAIEILRTYGADMEGDGLSPVLNLLLRLQGDSEVTGRTTSTWVDEDPRCGCCGGTMEEQPSGRGGAVEWECVDCCPCGSGDPDGDCAVCNPYPEEEE